MPNGISRLALEDIRDLREAGLTPTDEDVIRLNALALEISDCGETTAYNAPRFATAGGVTFWEPTLAAHDWYGFAKSFAPDAETDDWMFAFACANGRDRALLMRLRDKDGIERALGRFIGGIAATREEVFRAVSHLVDPGAEAEKTGLEKQAEASGLDAEQENRDALERLITEAAASIPGMTFREIMEQTPSRLCRMIEAAHAVAGLGATRKTGRAYARYLATLDATARRLKEGAAREARCAAADRLGQLPERQQDERDKPQPEGAARPDTL